MKWTSFRKETDNMTEFYESYIGTSQEEREEMLQELGYSDILDLFSDIPENVLLKDPIKIPGPFSEAELTRFFGKIANKNVSPSNTVSFQGGGVKQQYIPAAIEELMRRGELYTSYTPYQPEISQGMLQLIYEYQSMVAELLDMDVVNASMYDWGSAVGEAGLIIHRITRRPQFIIAEPVSPARLAVTRSYIAYSDIELIVIPSKDGKIDSESILKLIDEDKTVEKRDKKIGGVYFEVPSFFGTLPDSPRSFVDRIHENDSLVCVGTDPIACGILSPPGEYDVDLVVGEGQLLGNAISTGGPLLGLLAVKYDRKWIRELPGRLIGATTELHSSHPGYCITLQTREQHIRRDKATSNICTNQSIAAVNAAIYLASLGKQGVVELAQSLYDKAHYLANILSKINGISAPVFEPFFSEFVVDFGERSQDEIERKCIEKGFIPGIRVPGKSSLRLISTTELHTKSDLDNFADVIREVLK